MTPDEERHAHDSTRLAAWLGVLCLAAILALLWLGWHLSQQPVVVQR